MHDEMGTMGFVGEGAFPRLGCSYVLAERHPLARNFASAEVL